MKRVVSWVTMIAGVIAGCVLFSGIVRDEWEIAPYRPLIRSLRSDKADERLQAVMELGVVRLGGERVKMAVLPLMESLDDPDIRVRVAAAESLAWFGPDAAPAAIALARIIRDDHSNLRALAIRIVCLMGSDEANSILAEAMTDPEPGRRIETARVIGNHSIMATPYVPLLLENLRRDPTPAVRSAILGALVAIEPASDRIARARLEAMHDPDPETRKAAVLSLGPPDPLSSISPSFNSLLLQAAGDRDVGVRVEAIRMLGQIGLRHPDSVPALCQALADPGTRNEARIAIGHLQGMLRSEADPSRDTELDPAVPELLAAAKQFDPRTRGVIVSLLCRQICGYGRQNWLLPTSLRAAVPELLKIVKNAEPIVRLYALFELLDEPPNELLLPMLYHWPGERGEPAQDQASPIYHAWTAAIAAVDAKLKDRDPITKTQITLYFLPKDLIEFLLPTIIAATNDDDRDLRGQAMNLLGDIAHEQAGRAAHGNSVVLSTLPAITAALKSRFPDLREYASMILGNLGPAAKEAVPALRDMIATERDPAIRSRAERSLSSIAIVSKPNGAP